MDKKKKSSLGESPVEKKKLTHEEYDELINRGYLNTSWQQNNIRIK